MNGTNNTCFSVLCYYYMPLVKLKLHSKKMFLVHHSVTHIHCYIYNAEFLFIHMKPYSMIHAVIILWIQKGHVLGRTIYVITFYL